MAALACALLWGSSIAWAVPQPAGDKPTPPSLQEQRELDGLLATFARPGSKPADWIQAASRVLEIGKTGPRRLLPPLSAKVQSLSHDYHGAFVAAAARARIAKLSELAKAQGQSHEQLTAELKRLRRTVVDLARSSGLTDAAIRDQADPAMVKLNAALVVDRAGVLESSAAMQQQRKDLLALAELHRRCKAAVADETGRPPPAANPQDDTDKSLTAYEDLSALLAMPMDAAARRTLLANAQAESQLEPQEAQCTRDLNRIRLLLGLQALAVDLKLCKAARGHSTDMKEKGFFSHTSPVPGKSSPSDRARLAGTSANAENIAHGIADGVAVNRMWFHSPGHLANMLGTHKRVGVGYDEKWTQMFGS